MGKLIVVSLLKLTITILATQFIIAVVLIGIFGISFENNVGLFQFLHFFNSFYWGYTYGTKLGRDMREMRKKNDTIKK